MGRYIARTCWSTTAEILKAAGFPSQILVLDFETPEDPGYDLHALGTIPYILDKRFKVCLVGFWLGSAEQVESCQREQIVVQSSNIESLIESLQDLYGSHWEDLVVVGHNLFFDAAILKIHYGLVPKYFVDTRDLASSIWPGENNSLETLAPLVGLRKRNRIEASNQRLLDFAVQEQIEYCREDVFITARLFTELVKTISIPSELQWFSHHLTLYLRDSLLVDQVKLQAIYDQINRELLHRSMALNLTLKEINSQQIVDKLLAKDPNLPTKQTKVGPRLPVSKDDPEREQLLQHPDPFIREVVSIKIGIQSQNAFLARIKKFLAWTLPSGYIPICIRPWAAISGRSGGWGGLNFLNLAVRAGGLGTEIRQGLQAPPNHVIMAADFAAIESRVLAWVASQQDLLEAYRNGQDVYSLVGCKLFKTEVRKPRPDDPPDKAKQLERLRFLAKATVLGCGYGLGAAGLYRILSSKVEVTEQECRKLVREFRSNYADIPKLWDRLWRALQWVFTVGPGHRARVGLITLEGFENPSGKLDIYWTLPSGRALWYHDVVLSGDKIFMGADELWYGRIVENCVQAIARDILLNAVLTMESQGLHVAYHIYDSIGLIVHQKDVDKTKDLVYSIMRASPRWAQDLPLDCEVKISKYFE